MHNNFFSTYVYSIADSQRFGVVHPTASKPNRRAAMASICHLMFFLVSSFFLEAANTSKNLLHVNLVEWGARLRIKQFALDLRSTLRH